MSRLRRLLCFLLIAAPFLASCVDPVAPVRGVLERTVGRRSGSFDLRLAPGIAGRQQDWYDVRAVGGRVFVTGSTGVAVCRGAYDYIRNVCHRQVSWEHPRVSLPDRLPDMANKHVVCPNKYRHYFNVCTFGYSTVWWDWKRWRQEIDWMALHGINMPLAMNGQEAVWQKVWLRNGLKAGDLDDFFSGPAFLPWQRMGNINAHMGPLTQHWIDGQAILQKQILMGERELGMTPVTPGFSGFIPPAYARKHPELKVIRSTAWAGFEPTYIVMPAEPLFQTIGKQYISEYRKEFGSDHLYLCDTFNEMPPQFPSATKLKDLHDTGKAVYDSILAGDPQGIWVMQGWLFFNEQAYWGDPEIDAMLGAAPDDRMIVIDLADDLFEGWRRHAAVRNKQWIFCTLHNFGQTTSLFGNLPAYAKRPIEALNDPGHGHMAGMGITPEGIEQNDVVYELATDMMWLDRPVDLDSWLHGYVVARYGADDPKAQEAWSQMLKSFYSGGYMSRSEMYMLRPGTDAGGEPGPMLAQTRKILDLLLQVQSETSSTDVLARDVVDVGKRYLEECGAALLHNADIDRQAGKSAEARKGELAYLELLSDLDQLLATRPEFRLNRWVDAARRWGGNPTEKNQNEVNTRTQITVWGGTVLHDYAWKEWSGLTVGFYAERWKRYFVAQAAHSNGPSWDRQIAAWEEDWTKHPARAAERTGGNSLKTARELEAKYAGLEAMQPDRGIAVGKPVTSSGGTEQEHVPGLITDGFASGDYWAASPYPPWVQIDMEKPTEVGAIQLFPYFDGERYYRYTVEVSLDGQNWKRVIDQSQNSKPATSRGERFDIAPTNARYIRIDMLSNSANVGVHLYEVRVFGPGEASQVKQHGEVSGVARFPSNSNRASNQ